MASKKDKDAEAGLQVLGILSVIWTLGFFYFTRNGDLLGIGVSQLSMVCCNSVNILFMIIFIASWRYTVRENKVKKYLDEYFISHDSVSLKFLMAKFNISPSTASKALAVWLIETNVKGEYDHISGIFKKEPVEIKSSEVVDVEFQDVPDEILSFCPKCGNKLKIDLVNNTNWCETCKKDI